MAATHDLVILGAGPAGSMAALVAARAGLHVAVLDKAAFPRPKICGDCIHPRIWSLFDRWDLSTSFARLPHHRLTGIRLSSDFQRPLEFSRFTATREHRTVRRSDFDQWLKSEAESSGAVFHTETVPQALESAPDPALQTNRGTFTARVILGADGRNSWLARAAGLQRRGPRCRRIAWQTTLPSQSCDDAVHMTFFSEGYFGLARNGPDSANLCMVLQDCPPSTAQAVAERFFPGCGTLAWRSTHPLTRPAFTAAQGRILLAGDAARVVEPFTGEGITLAVESGALAAGLVVEALRDGTLDTLAARYRREHQRLYRRLSWQNALTRWLGRHPALGRLAVRGLGRAPALARALCGPFLK